VIEEREDLRGFELAIGGVDLQFDAFASAVQWGGIIA